VAESSLRPISDAKLDVGLQQERADTQMHDLKQMPVLGKTGRPCACARGQEAQGTQIASILTTTYLEAFSADAKANMASSATKVFS
jgi:hypothetical protein